MKQVQKWIYSFGACAIVAALIALGCAIEQDYMAASLVLVITCVFVAIFILFVQDYRKISQKSDIDISRFIGVQGKDALVYGRIGLFTYDQSEIISWASNYLKPFDLVGKPITSWIPALRPLLNNEIDSCEAKYEGKIYRFQKAKGRDCIFVQDITQMAELEKEGHEHTLVIGIADLNNYSEYENNEDEQLLAQIDASLKGLLITWANERNVFIRRLHSDRYLLVTDSHTLEQLRSENFPILQKFKDRAKEIEVSMTLSIALVTGTYDFNELNRELNSLLDLVNSRGGDQIGIKKEGSPVEFIGGNSERASERSTVRVRIVSDAIEDMMDKAGKIYIAGHTNTDFDCFGAAVAMSNWAKAMEKDAYIVLKDVPRDKQLNSTMQVYSQPLANRHSLISPEEAFRLFNPARDLLVLVDHNLKELSSGKELLEAANTILIIDHHRRSEHSIKDTSFSYVESKASSTSELVTELIQQSPRTIPIYEAEATLMLLGIEVDTNGFKTHTSERTLQAAAVLRGWGANTTRMQQALQEDYQEFIQKNKLYTLAQVYKGRFMIAASEEPISRTLISQAAEQLLNIKGIQAAFVIGQDGQGSAIASARGNGSFNVQQIMEKLGGGGHFSAAATMLEGKSSRELEKALKNILDHNVMEKSRRIENPKEKEEA